MHGLMPNPNDLSQKELFWYGIAWCVFGVAGLIACLIAWILW